MLALSLGVLAYLALVAAVLVLLRAAKLGDEAMQREYEALMSDAVPWRA